jgi:undecaprenyl-diphosphatase
MSIYHFLVSLDKQLFVSLNGAHNGFWDGFMYAVSGKYLWLPLYAVVLYLIIKNWKKQSLWVVLSVVLCVVISDQIASGFFKNVIHRLRPSHLSSLEGVIHLVKGYKGSLYGFASSHASNSFGFAIITSLIVRQRWTAVLLLLWAIIVSYSRIYLGLHYPADVIGGAMIGMISAYGCLITLKKFRPSVLENEMSINCTNYLLIVLLIIFLVVIGYSLFVF